MSIIILSSDNCEVCNCKLSANEKMLNYSHCDGCEEAYTIMLRKAKAKNKHLRPVLLDVKNPRDTHID